MTLAVHVNSPAPGINRSVIKQGDVSSVYRHKTFQITNRYYKIQIYMGMPMGM